MVKDPYGRGFVRPIFDAFSDPAQLSAAQQYTGEDGSMSAIRVSQTNYEVYLHDEVTPGGHLLAGAASLTALATRIAALEADAPDDYVAFSNLVGTDLQIILNNGSTVTADVTPLFDNVNVVPGVYGLTGTVTSIPLTNGASLDIDANALATDTELAAAIAALPPEEFVNTIMVNTSGVATFVTNQGNTAGTLDVAAIADSVDTYLDQPTLVGTVVTFPMVQGTSYNLDLTALNESLTDNGDGTLTWNDGAGGSLTFAVDTDDQSVASSNGSIAVVPTTQPNGQIDYDIRTAANIVPAVDPTGNGGTTTQDAIDNVYSIVAGFSDVRLQSATLAGTVMNFGMSDGSTIVANVSALLDNNNVTPGSYAITGSTTNLPLTNGGTITLDSSAMATDAELAAAIGALPGDEVLASVNVAGGVATFVTNLGNNVGTLDVGAIASGLEENLLAPTLSGNVITFPMAQGGFYTLDLSTIADAVDEDLVDNGDGTFTFTDGDGSTVSFAADTDVSASRIDYDVGTQMFTVGVTEDGVEVTDTQLFTEPYEFQLCTTPPAVVNIPNGTFPGQIKNIYWGGVSTGLGGDTAEVSLTSAGILLRDFATKRVNVLAGSTKEARVGEFWRLRWDGSSWRGVANCYQYNFASGSVRWSEQVDGRFNISILANASGAALGEIFGVPLPFAVANPTQLHVTMTDYVSNAFAIGDTPTPATVSSNHNFIYWAAASTATELAVSYDNLDAAVGNPGLFVVEIHNAIFA